MVISWGNHQDRGIKVSANDLNFSRDFRSELAVEVGKTSSVANDHFFGDSQPNKLAKAFSCGVDMNKKGLNMMEFIIWCFFSGGVEKQELYPGWNSSFRWFNLICHSGCSPQNENSLEAWSLNCCLLATSQPHWSCIISIVSFGTWVPGNGGLTPWFNAGTAILFWLLASPSPCLATLFLSVSYIATPNEIETLETRKWWREHQQTILDILFFSASFWRLKFKTKQHPNHSHLRMRNLHSGLWPFQEWCDGGTLQSICSSVCSQRNVTIVTHPRLTYPCGSSMQLYHDGDVESVEHNKYIGPLWGRRSMGVERGPKSHRKSLCHIPSEHENSW